MKLKDGIILIFVSVLITVFLFFISHHLKLIDINNVVSDRLTTLIYSIVYLIISNILIYAIYSMFFLNKGTFLLYSLFGIIDFLVFVFILLVITDLDILKAGNELFFSFLIRVCNSFFICYSIYYANLVECNR